MNTSQKDTDLMKVVISPWNFQQKETIWSNSNLIISQNYHEWKNEGDGEKWLKKKEKW